MATTPQQPPFEQQQGYKGATQVPLKPKIAAQELNNLLTDSLRTKLTTTPAKALAPNFGSVVFAKTTDTVGYVFQKLIDCGILSMPVLDVQTNNFVAFVDMLDVLAWIVSIGQLPTDPGSLYKEWQRRIALFETTFCSDLLKRPHRHPWLTLTRDLPLQKAIDFMVQHHANRIGLIEPNGTFSSILTQHRIIKWLSGMNQDEMGQRLANSSIAQLGIGFRQVVTIKIDQPLFAAFLAMYNQRVSGVAVVDEVGKFLGNVSVNDLKDIGHVGQNYEKMFMPVGTFLKIKEEGMGVPLVYCTKNSSLKEVLGKFKSFIVHRVYIVEKNTHLLQGVITPSDVLQLFARTPVTATPPKELATRTGVPTTGGTMITQFPTSEAEFFAFMNQMEQFGGLLPLMMELAAFPDLSAFEAREYGFAPTEPLVLWQPTPFFGAFTPPKPFKIQTTPARIDVTEEIKTTQKIPGRFKEGLAPGQPTAAQQAQQNA